MCYFVYVCVYVYNMCECVSVCIMCVYYLAGCFAGLLYQLSDPADVLGDVGHLGRVVLQLVQLLQQQREGLTEHAHWRRRREGPRCSDTHAHPLSVKVILEFNHLMCEPR